MSEPPPISRALANPAIARALIAMYEDYARPWSIADMAAVANMSRASFAATFKDIVRTMHQWKVSALPVLESGNRVVGVVSDPQHRACGDDPRDHQHREDRGEDPTAHCGQAYRSARCAPPRGPSVH